MLLLAGTGFFVVRQARSSSCRLGGRASRFGTSLVCLGRLRRLSRFALLDRLCRSLLFFDLIRVLLLRVDVIPALHRLALAFNGVARNGEVLVRHARFGVSGADLVRLVACRADFLVPSKAIVLQRVQRRPGGGM